LLVHNFSGGSTVVEADAVATAACGFCCCVAVLLSLPAFTGSDRSVVSGVDSGLDTTGDKVRAEDNDDDDGVERGAVDASLERVA
jgi:hypothetical protein